MYNNHSNTYIYIYICMYYVLCTMCIYTYISISIYIYTYYIHTFLDLQLATRYFSSEPRQLSARPARRGVRHQNDRNDR